MNDKGKNCYARGKIPADGPRALRGLWFAVPADAGAGAGIFGADVFATGSRWQP